jgi:hypothetical protein
LNLSSFYGNNADIFMMDICAMKIRKHIWICLDECCTSHPWDYCSVKMCIYLKAQCTMSKIVEAFSLTQALNPLIKISTAIQVFLCIWTLFRFSSCNEIAESLSCFVKKGLSVLYLWVNIRFFTLTRHILTKLSYNRSPREEWTFAVNRNEQTRFSCWQDGFRILSLSLWTILKLRFLFKSRSNIWEH